MQAVPRLAMPAVRTMPACEVVAKDMPRAEVAAEADFELASMLWNLSGRGCLNQLLVGLMRLVAVDTLILVSEPPGKIFWCDDQAGQMRTEIVHFSSFARPAEPTAYYDSTGQRCQPMSRACVYCASTPLTKKACGRDDT